jgi:hypothetical protein
MTTPVAVEVPDVTTIALDATHRCDRCGAQAFVATQHGKSELLWCAHHFTEHEKKLADAKVVDDRSKINSKASVSAY